MSEGEYEMNKYSLDLTDEEIWTITVALCLLVDIEGDKFDGAEEIKNRWRALHKRFDEIPIVLW